MSECEQHDIMTAPDNKNKNTEILWENLWGGVSKSRLLPWHHLWMTPNDNPKTVTSYLLKVSDTKEKHLKELKHFLMEC
jgi:heat shock protein HspQ